LTKNDGWNGRKNVDEEDGRMGRTIYIKLIFDEE